MPVPGVPLTAALPLRVPDPRALALREALLRDLSRGIAAGAVSPVDRLPTTATAASADGGGPVVLPMDSGTAPVEPPPDAAQIRVRPGGSDPVLDVAGTGQPCFAEDRLDIASWGDDRPVAAQLAEAQAGVLGEFDRPVPERLEALVRLKLHLGFGAEARALIRTWGAELPERRMLDAMGALVDGQSGTGTFAGMQGCDGPAALWAVLDAKGPPAAGLVNAPAVVRTHSALPIALRRHLGPLLSERFLAAGDTMTARAIRDAIDRAPGPHGSGLALVDASLALAEGEPVAAERKLEEVVANDDLAAGKALASLIDSRVRRGEAPDPAQLLALEALVLERKGMPETGDMRAALARGLAVTGGAEQAFRDLAVEDPALYPDLWRLLAERGEAIELAALALDPPGPAPGALPPAIRQAVAERLLQGGFADGAARWVDGAPGPEFDRMRARIALADRDGRAVLRHLAGQDGPDAEALRAAAHELLGELEPALAAWTLAGQPDQARRVQFLLRDWDAVDPGTDAQLSQVLAARRDAPDQAAAPDAITLSAARSLLDDTRQVRDGIVGLLATQAVPDG